MYTYRLNSNLNILFLDSMGKIWNIIKVSKVSEVVHISYDLGK